MARKDERSEGPDQGRGTWTSRDGWSALQRHRGKLILGAIVLSALAHTVSVVRLGSHRRQDLLGHVSRRPPVKIRVIPVPPRKQPEVKPPTESPDAKKILETPQEQTEAPDDARYLGTVDHKARQEIRIADSVPRDKAKDPGQKGKPDEAKPDKDVTEPKPKQPQPEATVRQNEVRIKERRGNLSFGAFTPDRKPRNTYEALLPTSFADLPGQISAGFQDYVDDKVLEGDRIDISTSEYRYIGYFTGMRKAIELVWTYPMEASRRGMQGEVGLEFAIGKDGKASRIRVIKSSGYPILDRAIVEAIRLASPFAPLPAGFGRNRMVVTGSFRYILSAYGSH